MTTDDEAALLDDLRAMWGEQTRRRPDWPPPWSPPSRRPTWTRSGRCSSWSATPPTGRPRRSAAWPLRGCSASTPTSGWSLEAEIDGDEVRGQLLDLDGDPGAVVVGLETRDGSSWTTELDEVGFFSMRAGAAGSVRFTVRIGRTVATSGWLDV